MAVSWEIRDRVLIVTVVGDWAGGGPASAISQALASPRFQAGTALLLDVRQSRMNPSGRDVSSSVGWLATLREKGLSPRVAVVVGAKEYQFGIARMASAYFENRGMELKIFSAFDEALTWLTALGGTGAAQKSTGT